MCVSLQTPTESPFKELDLLHLLAAVPLAPPCIGLSLHRRSSVCAAVPSFAPPPPAAPTTPAVASACCCDP